MKQSSRKLCLLTEICKTPSDHCNPEAHAAEACACDPEERHVLLIQTPWADLLHDFEDEAEEDAAGGCHEGAAPQVGQPRPVAVASRRLVLVIAVGRRRRRRRGKLGAVVDRQTPAQTKPDDMLLNVRTIADSSYLKAFTQPLRRVDKRAASQPPLLRHPCVILA